MKYRIGYEGMDFFKLYHPSSKSLGPVTPGAGNDLVAVAAVGIILVVIVLAIVYFMKRYKQKYNF